MIKNFLKFLFLILCLYPSVSFARQSIGIAPVAPSSEEVLLLNQTYKIKWGGGPDKVDLILFTCPWPDVSPEDCTFSHKIAENISNTNEYDWLISKIPPATYYYETPTHFQIDVVESGKYIPDTSLYTLTSEHKSFMIADQPKLDFNDKEPILYLRVALKYQGPDYLLQVRWKTDYISRCDASGDWSGKKGLRPDGNYETLGKNSDFLTEKIYTLTCKGPAGTVTKSVTINVTKDPYESWTPAIQPPQAVSPVDKKIPTQETQSTVVVMPAVVINPIIAPQDIKPQVIPEEQPVVIKKKLEAKVVNDTIVLPVKNTSVSATSTTHIEVSSSTSLQGSYSKQTMVQKIGKWIRNLFGFN